MRASNVNRSDPIIIAGKAGTGVVPIGNMGVNGLNIICSMGHPLGFYSGGADVRGQTRLRLGNGVYASAHGSPAGR